MTRAADPTTADPTKADAVTTPEVQTLAHPPRLGPIFARAALSRASGGETLPEVQLRLTGQRVNRGRLVSYQRLCGFGVSDTLPHTFPHLLGFGLQAELMSRRSFPLPLTGLVHVANSITVERALDADEALDIVVHAERLRPHTRGRQVDLVTHVSADGQRVWSGRSTYLARGAGDPDTPREQPPAMPAGATAARWSVPADLGRQYAAVSGDVNPIHLSALSAKALGFPRAIAHGMWTYARTLAALGRRVDQASTSRVWFAKPVLLPGTVDLVVDSGGTPLVAGLRSRRTPQTSHLVLTLD